MWPGDEATGRPGYVALQYIPSLEPRPSMQFFFAAVEKITFFHGCVEGLGWRLVHTHWFIGSLGGVSGQLLQQEHEQAAPLLHAGVEEGLVADLPLVAQVLRGARGSVPSARHARELGGEDMIRNCAWTPTFRICCPGEF